MRRGCTLIFLLALPRGNPSLQAGLLTSPPSLAAFPPQIFGTVAPYTKKGSLLFLKKGGVTAAGLWPHQTAFPCPVALIFCERLNYKSLIAFVKKIESFRTKSRDCCAGLKFKAFPSL
jgi:hypothetical protein